MSSRPLSRIPFRLEDEQMILSMARWMRFIGIFGVVANVLGLMGSLVITTVLSAIMIEPPERLTAQVESQVTKSLEQTGKERAEGKVEVAPDIPANVNPDGSIRVGQRTISAPTFARTLAGVLAQNRVGIFALSCAGLLLTAILIAAFFVLIKAGDDFDMVARTDHADQEFLTSGLINLKTFFKLGIVVVVVMFLLYVAAVTSLSFQVGAALSPTLTP